MKWVLVYKGKGMYEQDTEIVKRVMNEFVDTTVHQVDTVSAEDIIRGTFSVKMPFIWSEFYLFLFMGGSRSNFQQKHA